MNDVFIPFLTLEPSYTSRVLPSDSSEAYVCNLTEQLRLYA